MAISVIIRFKNEEKYLEATFKAVREQIITTKVEIIAVNDNSDDLSLSIAEKWADKIIDINGYRPGHAINIAVKSSTSSHYAVLSAHTIPANKFWLSALYNNFKNPMIAGVYGSQVYNLNCKFLDKRELDYFSSDIERIEKKDADFWNANSMFSKECWELEHFNEEVFELEDHYWSKLLLPKGYVIKYEPKSLVYHYTHILRNDREFLPHSELSKTELIEQSILALNDPNSNWPTKMIAGLTLASLTRQPEIKTAVDALGKTLLNDIDFDVRWRMAHALGKIPNSNSSDYLVKALWDSSYYPRDEAAWALARLGEEGVNAIKPIFDSLPEESKLFAALACGLSNNDEGEKMAISYFTNLIDRVQVDLVIKAVYFIGEISKINHSEVLYHKILPFLSHEDITLRTVTSWAIGNFSHLKIIKFPSEKLNSIVTNSQDYNLRVEAVIALGKKLLFEFDNKVALDTLMNACNHEHPRIRYAALQSIRILNERGYKIEPPTILSKIDDYGVEFELKLIQNLIQ